MRILTVSLLTFAIALWSWPSHSQTGSSQAEWINAMRQGGYVIVLRHGATPTDQADTDPLHLENVAQQRQLNDQGREQARFMGAAMHKLNIPVGQVHTSAFNRAVETGHLLGFGEVKPSLDFAEGGLVVAPVVLRPCARSRQRCHRRARTSSSSPTGPTFSMPSVRNGSTCVKARHQYSRRM